jgi:Tat protein secretion system quality control protein TatD with DNase activity
MLLSIADHKGKLKKLIEKCGDKCIAIGECGLDFSQKYSNEE